MVATAPLIAVAHGSRDPRSAATMHAAVERIRAARPGLDVRLCFLDLNAPSVDQVIDGVAAQGHDAAVVAPLLLGSAFHARVDLPGMLAVARARHPRLTLVQADVLGTDNRLAGAVRRRVIDTGADPFDDRLGIAVAAVGSSSGSANALTGRVVGRIAAGTRWRMRICFATATRPTVAEALSGLRAEGAERFVVAPWFLAPGLLTDRVAAAAEATASGTVVAQTIGAHPWLVDVVLDRYDTALRDAERPVVISA